MSIIFSNLDFSFDADVSAPLFRDFSLSIQDGSINALLGYSGTGKTTLLRLISGALPAPPGSLTMSRPHRFGYVPQESSLLPWLSVRENLALGGSLLNGEEELADWRTELTRAFALTEALDHKPRTLSGGMRQRAALVSALSSGGDVLLLDEPFSGSDGLRKKVMIEAILSFGRRMPDGIIVFTTHDPTDVFALGAAATWLDVETRQPTIIKPASEGWNQANRKRLLELMIGEPV